MGDRKAVRGAFAALAFKVVLQDGFDRGIGAGIYLQCPLARGFQPLGSMGFGQFHDPQAGPEALFRMPPVAQDHLHQYGAVLPDLGGLALDPFGRPVRISAMAGWHVVTHRRVLVVARDDRPWNGDDPQRLIDRAPFGHWNTQTFIAALRCDRLVAPWVIKGAINRDLFNTYVETQLAPTLRRGDVVILDNLSSHKSAYAADVPPMC
jgi:DDE superfamily endonuclease